MLARMKLRDAGPLSLAGRGQRRGRLLLAAAAGACLAAGWMPGPGCAAIRQLAETGPVTMRSLAAGRRLALRPVAAAKRTGEDGALRAVATDIPPRLWSQPLETLEGSVIVIERFFAPKPGRTPMEASSSNASVRWVVLAKGAVGLYEGGAMVEHEGSLFGGGATLFLRGATLRLGAQSAGFVDALGPSSASGAFAAPEDPQRAAALERLVQRAVAATRPVEQTPSHP